MAPRATAAALRELQAACRDCHVCVDAGIIPEANPTFSGAWGAPFFLVGQAPGPAGRGTAPPSFGGDRTASARAAGAAGGPSTVGGRGPSLAPSGGAPLPGAPPPRP